MEIWATIVWTVSILLDGLFISIPNLNGDGQSANQDLFSDLTDWHFKRDSCADAFGAGASNSICAPSNTLCCTRTNQTFPSCQQFLGKGWCCVGANPSDDCYVDQASACGDTNAVICTNTIEDGSAQVCCPRLTSCVPGYTVSDANVRCQIKFGDLQKLAVSSASSSSPYSSTFRAVSSAGPPVSASSSSSSSPSLAVTPVTATAPVSSTTTSPQGQQTQTPLPAASPALPGGVIAGISVGLTLAVGIAAMSLILYLRSRHKAKGAPTSPEQLGVVPPSVDPYKSHHEQGGIQEMYVQQVYYGYAPREESQCMERSNPPSYPVEMEAIPRL